MSSPENAETPQNILDIVSRITDTFDKFATSLLRIIHIPLRYSFSKTFLFDSENTKIDFDSPDSEYENKRKTPLLILGITIIPDDNAKEKAGLLVTVENVPIIKIDQGAMKNIDNHKTSYANGRVIKRDEKIKFFATSSDGSEVEFTANVEVGSYYDNRENN